jgi:hypothetical protein
MVVNLNNLPWYTVINCVTLTLENVRILVNYSGIFITCNGLWKSSQIGKNTQSGHPGGQLYLSFLFSQCSLHGRGSLVGPQPLLEIIDTKLELFANSNALAYSWLTYVFCLAPLHPS